MRLKAWLYRLIRPLFVRDIDPNEEYVCVMCCEPVLRRSLTCSKRCAHEFELALASPQEIPDR